MSKYHIGKNGKPSICKANKGNCPLGGEHFDSRREAETFVEGALEREFGLIHMDEKPSFYSKEELENKFPDLNRSQIEKIQKYVDLESELYEKTESLKAADSDFKGTDEYFNEVQETRKLALKKYRAHAEIKDSISQENIDDLVSPILPEKKPWKRSSNYQFHPEISDKNFKGGIGGVMSAYSGKPMEQIESEIKAIRNSDESLHDVSRRYWKTLKQRNDKPIVSLDLETANPRDKSLDYDNGQLTYTIEVGAIKTYPDGRIERLDFKSGIPSDFSDRHGTGFQETHNITVEDLKGESEFSSDSDKQKKTMDFLEGSVVIAHNASFEKRQLTNSLRGFRKAVNDGNIEMLDTMQFCKFMVPESERNTNQAFVEAAGYEYKGAHRAYADADMTLNAFNKLKDNR